MQTNQVIFFCLNKNITEEIWNKEKRQQLFLFISQIFVTHGNFSFDLNCAYVKTVVMLACFFTFAFLYSMVKV